MTANEGVLHIMVPLKYADTSAAEGRNAAQEVAYNLDYRMHYYPEPTASDITNDEEPNVILGKGNPGHREVIGEWWIEKAGKEDAAIMAERIAERSVSYFDDGDAMLNEETLRELLVQTIKEARR